MIKEIINKLKNNKKQLQTLKANSENIKEEKSFDITVFKKNNISEVIISDYISGTDYIEKMKLIDKDLINLISNNILWNNSEQKINKGHFYIIFHSDKLYNILISGNIIKIDQRIKKDDITEERIINIDTNNNVYYSSFKHDKIGSTFYHKFYSKNRLYSLGDLDLSKDDALREIKTILFDLEQFDGIENIIDLELLKQSILDDLSEGSFKKKMH